MCWNGDVDLPWGRYGGLWDADEATRVSTRRRYADAAELVIPADTEPVETSGDCRTSVDIARVGHIREAITSLFETS